MGEMIFLLVLLAVCAGAYYMTFDFPVSLLDKSGGAAIFPRMIITALVVFITIRLIQIFLEKHKKPFVLRELFVKERGFFYFSLFLYIACFNFLGYIVSTILFLLTTTTIFFKFTHGSYGSKKQIAVRSILVVCFVVLMNAFFVDVINILLPRGIFARLF